MAEEVERFKKQQEDKTVSLNYQKRRDEKAKNAARLEIREQHWASRAADEPVIYEINLKNVGEPGLPKAKSEKGLADASEESLVPTARNTGGLDEEEMEEKDSKVNPPDLHLREAEQILLDLIQLNKSKRGVAARSSD